MGVRECMGVYMCVHACMWVYVHAWVYKCVRTCKIKLCRLEYLLALQPLFILLPSFSDHRSRGCAGDCRMGYHFSMMGIYTALHQTIGVKIMEGSEEWVEGAQSPPCSKKFTKLFRVKISVISLKTKNI